MHSVNQLMSKSNLACQSMSTVVSCAEVGMPKKPLRRLQKFHKLSLTPFRWPSPRLAMKQEEHEDTSKFSSHFGFPLQREFCAFWNTLSSKGSRTNCTTFQCRCQGTATLYEQNGPNKHSPKEAIQYSHISIHIYAYMAYII